MIIVSYNILDGGEGRADPLAEVILAQRPDIVAIAEADDPAVLDRLSMRLQMDYIQAVGNSHASALFSRWPIVQTVNHALLRPRLSRSLLEAAVRDPSGKDWLVGVVHLHAKATEADEQAREAEVEELLNVFEPARSAGRPHLIAGDFNSVSPLQEIDPARLKPSSRKAWEENGHQLPRRAIGRMLDAGYVDSLAVVDPQLARVAGTSSTQHPGQRVDYMFGFGFPTAAYRRAWIEQDRLAKYASDHFPIGLEILEPAATQP